MTGTSHTKSSVTLARMPSGRPVDTVVHRYEGSQEGPTVYLQALQHGGEVNGAEVLRRLNDRLEGAEIEGTVIAVPVANPLAFDHRVYMGPTRLDAINTNMNRLWPGDPDGTLTERMAATLWELVTTADAVVDLHTGGPEMRSHVRFSPGQGQARAMAAAFGIEHILAEGDPPDTGVDEHGSEGAERGPHDPASLPTGKLRAVAAAAGIPAITPELAHSREIVEDSVTAGVTGVLNVLREVGALPGEPDEPEPTVWTRIDPVFTSHSGLFRASDVSVGETVTTGTRLGTVYDPTAYESRETIEADHDGLLLSLNRGSTVIEGESVGSIARQE